MKWSLEVGGLCSRVNFFFKNETDKIWNLYTGGIFSQVIDSTGLTVFEVILLTYRRVLFRRIDDCFAICSSLARIHRETIFPYNQK